jgi:hypothetical protein
MLHPKTASSLLLLCGYAEIATGVVLFALLAASLYSADDFLVTFLGLPRASLGVLGGNSWQQAAVAFGMHAYADVANGLEQVQRLRASRPLPRVVTLWNSTRFLISFIFLLTLARGLFAVHGSTPAAWPTGALALLALLALDAVLVRPLAVLCQRALEDARPLAAQVEAKEWAAFSPLQRLCRGVFYYEAVLSGTSGLAYMLVPQLFTWLFDFPAAEAGSSAVLFGLSNFGGLVSAFGLYQMKCVCSGAARSLLKAEPPHSPSPPSPPTHPCSADIDTRSGHIAWWLILDLVWLYVYWVGVTAVHGPWNPLTLTGSRPFCHIAFHADSTLALARTVFLYTVYTRGRQASKVSVSIVANGSGSGSAGPKGRSASAKRQ